MPSGAKKRKAAKKKKEQAANNNNNPHGHDDPRSQDERDSDGGDVGSPASQDNHNQHHPFGQGEEEGKRESSPEESHITEDKSVEEATRDIESIEISGVDDVVAVKIEKELVPEKDLGSTCVDVQRIEHDKRSSSSSSSGHGSDDEFQASEKKSKEVTSYVNEDKSAIVIPQVVPKVAENETSGHVDFVVETVTVDNLVKSVAEEVNTTENFANKSVSDVVESGLTSEEKSLPPSNGIPRVELEVNEGNNFPSLGTATTESSNVTEKPHDSGLRDYSEKQPPVASTPPVVQRTSILSCCGLLDAFTGS